MARANRRLFVSGDSIVQRAYNSREACSHCFGQEVFGSQNLFKPLFNPRVSSFQKLQTSIVSKTTKPNQPNQKCNSTLLTTRTDPSPATIPAQEASHVLYPYLTTS